MASEPLIDFDIPDGNVVVQNISRDVELPFENRRLIPMGGLWHLPAAELDGHDAADGHQQWRRYEPAAALPVPPGPPIFLTDDPTEVN